MCMYPWCWPLWPAWRCSLPQPTAQLSSEPASWRCCWPQSPWGSYSPGCLRRWMDLWRTRTHKSYRVWTGSAHNSGDTFTPRAYFQVHVFYLLGPNEDETFTLTLTNSLLFFCLFRWGECEGQKGKQRETDNSREFVHYCLMMRN